MKTGDKILKAVSFIGEVWISVLIWESYGFLNALAFIGLMKAVNLAAAVIAVAIDIGGARKAADMKKDELESAVLASYDKGCYVGTYAEAAALAIGRVALKLTIGI